MAQPKQFRLVLASASPRRKALLSQIGVTADEIAPANINEDPIDGELPRQHAERLALEKALAVSRSHPNDCVLAADTVVGVGRRILPKTETADEARRCLELMSGRAHRVYTAVALWLPDTAPRLRISDTRVSFKRLTAAEIDAYLNSEQWQGKAGGYAIQGYAESFVRALSGSYSGVVGLPLFETRNLLLSAGFKI